MVAKVEADVHTARSSSDVVAEGASSSAIPSTQPITQRRDNPDSLAAASLDQEEKPRQIDPSNPSRRVAYKKQNTAFLAHQKHKAQEIEKRRARRRARGLPEDGKDDDEALELPSFRTVVKWALLSLIAILAMGQFITGDVLYGYKGRWRNPRRWIPVRQKIFTPAELALYNGRDDSRPVYLSIMGNVYDVTAGGKTYRPGGSYWFFSGKDASRAYTTGCFKNHLTHDLRGLSDAQVEQVREWDRFFANSPKYFKVGTLRLPAINPESPEPEPC